DGVLPDELRVGRAELAQPGLERVVVGIGDERRVLLVVRLIELAEPGLELLDLRPGAVEVLLRRRGGCGHTPSLGRPADTRSEWLEARASLALESPCTTAG